MRFRKESKLHKILAVVLSIMLIIGTMPYSFAAGEAGEASAALSTTLPDTLVRGVEQEYTVTTVPSEDDKGKMVRGYFTITDENGEDASAAIESLQYRAGDQWYDFVDNAFGPGNGFEYKEATSYFKVVIKTPGVYTVQISIKKVGTVEEGEDPVLASCEKKITVNKNASVLTTNIDNQTFCVGKAQEFTFTTEANDDKDVAVIGSFEFSNPDAIEKLEYLESKNGQWYEFDGDFGLPAGFPMSNATSKFRVTFKEAGNYTVNAFMKAVDGDAKLCSVEANVTVGYPISGNGPENGTVTYPETVVPGGSYTIKMIPDENYTVGSCTVNNIPVALTKTGNGYEATVASVNAPQEINVQFVSVSKGDLEDVTVAAVNAVRESEKELYVLPNPADEASVTFSSEKGKMTLYSGNEVVASAEQGESIALNETVKITKIVLNYKADNEAVAEDHVIDLDNPIQIVVDETAPTLQVQVPDANANNYYNSDVTIGVEADDPEIWSGIDSVEYYIGTEEPTDESVWTALTVTEDAAKATGEFVVDAETWNAENVYVRVKATDLAGNGSEIFETVLHINSTKPEIEVTVDGTPSVHAASEKYFNTDRTATVTIVDRADTFDQDSVVFTDVEDVTWDGQVATVIFSEEKEYDWSVSYTNKADLSAEAGDETPDYVFVIDKTDPDNMTIDANEDSILGNLIAFDKFFYNEKVVVTLTADGGLSGLQSLEYQKVDDASKYNVNGTWTAYPEDGIKIKPNEQFIIYVKATDNAGNVSYVYSTGVIVDDQKPTGENEAPVITVTPSKPAWGKGVYAAGDNPGFDIKVVEPKFIGMNADEEGYFSGLKTVTYTITNSTTGYTETVAVDVTEAGKLVDGWSKHVTIDPALFYSNDVQIVVTAEDNAGNVGEFEVTGLKIDSKAPVVTFSFDTSDALNGKYYDNAKTLTITVDERNFDAGYLPTVTGTNASGYTFSGWSNSGEKHTGTITFKADGDYAVSYDCIDLAGNKSNTATLNEITIDLTDPTISVAYDNNDVQNGTYYKAERTATITIVEHNFRASDVQVTATASLDGAAATVPTVSGWSNGGDRHTATIHFPGDADYTFDISYADMAGNAAADYAQDAFTVDKTIEAPVIGGVENGKAYKGAVVPTVDIEDVNLDSYEVKLTRTRMGEKDVDVTDAFISALTEKKNGYTGKFDTFKEIQENDGLYTLTVKLTDKAGNTAESSVTFSVNRFGSVYAYEQFLQDLIANKGAYVQSVTEDLVITEYNVDKLVADSVIVEITRDGKPLDNVLFDANPAVNAQVEVGESGWYQYVYTISKDNFTADGVYKISISSADAAGNTPENSNYEDKEILFYVDSTKPELTSIIGLEEAVINAQEVTVKYTVFDTIGLKSIKVYVDGQLVGEEITDFSADLNNYSGEFTLTEKNSMQHVQIVVEDLAGNVTDTEAEDFVLASAFHDDVTVSTNFFVRWFANPLLFWGSIILVLIVIGGVCFFIVAKRRKKEEK